jgi:hypothetical protein
MPSESIPEHREKLVGVLSGCVEESLFLIRAAIQERPAILVHHFGRKAVRGDSSQRCIETEFTNDLASGKPEIIDVATDGFGG